MLAQALLRTFGEPVEVRPPHADRRQQPEAGGDHELRGQVALRGPDADADRDDRFAQADDHERAVAVGEVRHRDVLQAPQPLAGQPRRAGVIDCRRERPDRQRRCQPSKNTAPAIRSAIPITTVTAKPAIADHDAFPLREASVYRARCRKRTSAYAHANSTPALSNACGSDSPTMKIRTVPDEQVARAARASPRPPRWPPTRTPTTPTTRAPAGASPAPNRLQVARCAIKRGHLRDREHEHEVPQQLDRAGAPLDDVLLDGRQRELGHGLKYHATRSSGLIGYLSLRRVEEV